MTPSFCWQERSDGRERSERPERSVNHRPRQLKSSTREAESSGFTKKSILSQVIALHILKIYPKCELIEILSGIYDKKWKFSRENMKDFDKLSTKYQKIILCLLYVLFENITNHQNAFCRYEGGFTYRHRWIIMSCPKILRLPLKWFSNMCHQSNRHIPSSSSGCTNLLPPVFTICQHMTFYNSPSVCQRLRVSPIIHTSNVSLSIRRGFHISTPLNILS